jgi:hypothetical protein
MAMAMRLWFVRRQLRVEATGYPLTFENRALEGFPRWLCGKARFKIQSIFTLSSFSFFLQPGKELSQVFERHLLSFLRMLLF